jgi:DNA-binding transcriptional LysR family regulator
MLDLRLLETFREVATRGSFSAAAEALSFTQPAVSQHIARLEKQVGAKLFERDARGVRPTRAGQTMLRHAEALLDAAARAEADVKSAAGLHVPHVMLGAFPTSAAGIVPMALRELRAAHPDVRAQLRVIEGDPALDELSVGRLDLTLLIGSVLNPAPFREGIETEEIMEDPMLVALPRSHRLATHPTIQMTDLAAEDWMLPANGGTCEDTSIVLRACAQAGYEPGVRFETDDYQALLGLTASGMGVTVIPSIASMSVPPEVVIRPFDGEPPKRIISVARRVGATNPSIDAAVDALRIAGRRLSLSCAVPVAA